MPYRILAVDDESSIRKALAMGLASLGYDVDVAADGTEALTLGRKAPYDVMLIDLRLPDGDGLEVVRQFTKMQPELVAIVITGSASLESSLAAIELQVGGYLQKPLSMQTVIGTLKQAIDRREQLQQRIQINKRDLPTPPIKGGGIKKEAVKTVPMLVHQIRNPLSAILGSAEMALFDLDDPRALRNHLQNIITATKAIDQINASLLGDAKPGASCFEAVNLRQALEQALAMFQDLMRYEGVILEVDSAAADGAVLGIRFELEQVFRNLILNGIQAMKDVTEKKLHVTAGTEHAGPQSRVAVRFSDTGCGITPEDQQRIFEARFTTKTNGIGIGLPVVRQLLHGMGGRIALENSSERGTVFVVSLPLLG